MTAISELIECIKPVSAMLRAGVPDQVMEEFREPFEAIETLALAAPSTCAGDVLAKLGVWADLVGEPDLLRDHHGPLFRQLHSEASALLP